MFIHYDNMSKFIQDEEESNDNTCSSSSSRSSSNNTMVKKILGFIPSGWADGSNITKKMPLKQNLLMGFNVLLKLFLILNIVIIIKYWNILNLLNQQR